MIRRKQSKTCTYLKDGLFQNVCVTTGTSQKNNMSTPTTQVSGITKHVSTKISTDNALSEGNQQEAQDGEIQSLEQEEQNGMSHSQIK